MSRYVVETIHPEEEEEGLGVKVKRTIGGSKMEYLDPFLLLDEFRATKPACFSDQPRRGFIMMTYMLAGCMKYEDFNGHQGEIHPGDAQWMTAGRGIVLSQMPTTDEETTGLHLWINSPSERKMEVPAYQAVQSCDVPAARSKGVTVKVLCGETWGAKSCVCTHTHTYVLDITMEKNSKFDQEIPAGWNAFVYVLVGKVGIGPSGKKTTGLEHQALLLSNYERNVHLHNKGSKTCHCILIAGKPLEEKVAREGVFVMNSEEEVRQSIKDYRLGRNGFENIASWDSRGGLEYLDSQF